MINCPVCNSTNVTSVEKWRRTNAPKNLNQSVGFAHSRRFVSYGYKFDKHTCVCGHEWEVKK